MSNYSFGLRKQKCCEQAIIKGLEFMNHACEWIVDIDLQKFFDTVEHDRLIRLIDDVFQNSGITALTRKFITAGVSIDGRVHKTEIGIPKGGPLSFVLANLYLDQADKELERRGLRFTRYADSLLIYVRSEAAANRVMESFTNYLEKKLKLTANAAKSKVARPDEKKSLSFSFKEPEGKWRAVPDEKSVEKLKETLKELTKRSWSISLADRIRAINQKIRGWLGCFKIAWVFRKTIEKIDATIRRRIRAIIWKQWKSIARREWGLIKLGCPKGKAHALARTRKSYARCSRSFLKTYIQNKHFAQKGLQAMEDLYKLIHIEV